MVEFFDGFMMVPGCQRSGLVQEGFEISESAWAAGRTEHPVALLQPMADDAHAAMRAVGREPMDRAFEAVERIGFALRHNLK